MAGRREGGFLRRDGYFFDFEGGGGTWVFLLSTRRFLAFAAASVLPCFWLWSFCFDFGDLSPMGLVWFGLLVSVKSVSCKSNGRAEESGRMGTPR